MFNLNKKKFAGCVLAYLVSVSRLFAITDPRSLDIVAVVEGSIDIQLNKDKLEATIKAPTAKSYSSIGNVTVTLENTFSKSAVLLVSDKLDKTQKGGAGNEFFATMEGSPDKKLPIMVTSNRDENGRPISTERVVSKNAILVSKSQKRMMRDYKVVVGVFAAYSPTFEAVPGKYETTLCFLWKSVE